MQIMYSSEKELLVVMIIRPFLVLIIILGDDQDWLTDKQKVQENA